MAESTRELKKTVLVACDALEESLLAIEQDLEEIFAFQIVDERTKLLTSVILECRLVMDPWPPRQTKDFVPSKKAFGSTPLAKLARSLELYVWDIRGRIASLKDWCLETESEEVLLKMTYDCRHISWLVKAYEDYDLITSKQMDEEIDSIGELSKEREKLRKSSFLDNFIKLAKREGKEIAPPRTPHIPFTDPGGDKGELELLGTGGVIDLSGAPSASKDPKNTKKK